jgi:hypothetical protein
MGKPGRPAVPYLVCPYGFKRTMNFSCRVASARSTGTLVCILIAEIAIRSLGEFHTLAARAVRCVKHLSFAFPSAMF